MKLLIVVFLLIGLFTGCNKRQGKEGLENLESIIVSDTIIGSKSITDEIAGSAYRKRAKTYFVIVNNDTSDFQCILAEAKEGGKVNLSLNLPYLKRTITYRQIIQELKLVLPEANKDFNLDSLKSVSYGRLILSGDLAIALTHEYIRKFGLKSLHEKPDYRIISSFLQGSILVSDLNSILKPYSISVDKVSFEKAFFTNRRELYWASKVETDSANAPTKILDCITYVILTSTK